MSEPCQEPTGRADGVPAVATGHPDVDEVLASLDRLDDLPVAAHVTMFSTAQQRLHEALTGSGAGPRPG
ncbi:MAG TPA: hypothetical protein VER39_02815 [Nocardioidaceae bacterium]|nr:hypothetical protein [Nocardioidaceae bacterium]